MKVVGRVAIAGGRQPFGGGDMCRGQALVTTSLSPLSRAQASGDPDLGDTSRCTVRPTANRYRQLGFLR